MAKQDLKKNIEKELDKILDELFDYGKKYGEDLNYAKGDALYILRQDSLDEAKEAILKLFK
jgi:hypothetical protein